MSKSDMTGQHTLEELEHLMDEEPTIPSATNHHAANGSAPRHVAAHVATAVKDSAHGHPPGSVASATHRDLTQIIARAREEIRHLREELTRHEAQIASIAHERDDIQQRFNHLYDNFLETVHMAAEAEILKTAHDLREGRIPKLFEPLQDSITLWLEEQQAEREAALRQKLDRVEQQADIIRQELMQEREALSAEREKFAQERQAFLEHMKTREAWLQHRWLAKAWGTAAVMFLVLPALQFYLLLQKADVWSIIIIPTTTCLVLTAIINLVRVRRRPPAKASSEKSSGEKK